jgi:tartrate-resistant acid phosphatase type 5
MKKSSKILIQSLINFTIVFFLVAVKSHAQRFAVIGDYGSGDGNERRVAELVKSWKPDFIITTGDNNYKEGTFACLDSTIGQFYSEYIYPYYGSFRQGDVSENRFFPTLGNHDVEAGNIQAYYDFFTLPGNERYYDFVNGQVHFFALNSNLSEPDGTYFSSEQSYWLRQSLKKSSSRWKIVYFHHPPYSSGYHGSTAGMQWPFGQWGTDAVISGHDHNYERLQVGSLSYFVNGSGGAFLRSFSDTLDESRVLYCENFGAQLVEAFQDSMVFSYININDSLIDRFILPYNPVSTATVSEFSAPDDPVISPNPFTQSITIQFILNHPSTIQIDAYNSMGELIDIITDKRFYPGDCSVEWKNSHLNPGIYYLVFSDCRFTKSYRAIKIHW